MSYKGRWQEPTDRTARDEYRELRRELKSSRTAKARRLEIETRLDEISLGGGTKEPSIEIREPKPTTSDLLALANRVEAAREMAEVFMPEAISYRECVRRRAECATAHEKAVAILSELPEHPLCKLAAELAAYIWSEDKSNPRPSVDVLAAERVKHWLSDAPYNRHDLRGSRATVDAAVADALRVVAERDSEDPKWFTKRAERLLDSPPTGKGQNSTVDAAAPPKAEPERHPLASANTELDTRAALILKTDSWLSRLAEHSPEMRARIVAGLSDEILRIGFVSGDFATKLYNNLRPRCVSAYPERKF